MILFIDNVNNIVHIIFILLSVFSIILLIIVCHLILFDLLPTQIDYISFEINKKNNNINPIRNHD